ncbi:Rha family transcriptional regulator [uncultured Cardiobacterium sp.]|uniref:Rha family transcriptional regulator n=1 Tax=uncultured Cardiobacterium sp. TaxID=417619 RepID=UPI00261D12F4|nr:Rha family transcriptional regulator [uncultured Cardiobacterium sp.]
MTSYKEPLVRFSGNRLITTSLAVSNHFQRNHRDVLTTIRSLDCSPEFRERNFTLSSYTTSQGKSQPMYEITRDGFSFLCMGFTGAQAAAWKEKYIAAFNVMEQELQQPASRLETHMAQLAAGMNTLLAQNRMVHKYIALLEMNQKGRRRIKREDEAIILQLRDEGLSQADIARLLRISATAVNRIIHGEYRFSDSPAGKGISELLEEMLAREQQQLAATLGLPEVPHA